MKRLWHWFCQQVALHLGEDFARWAQLRPLLYDRIHVAERRCLDAELAVAELTARLEALERTGAHVRHV